MKTFFYPRLAASGMKRNAKLYTPYLLTCVLMVAMEYIVLFLVRSPAINHLPGTEMLRAMMAMGAGIVALFAGAFLFYTHSFLYRRRMKEFGLYNMLGMGRWQLGCILVWESLLTAAIALMVGLGLGAALSKLAELVLIRLVEGDVTYTLSFSGESVRYTMQVFGVIFAVILVHNLIQVHRTSAVQLLKTEQLGEKPPKANWLFGLGGAVLLGFAYWLAISIREPLSALIWFFVAVAMVIVATYLLFIAGSVLLCRILQKNKRYYYQSAHFVSVSSMMYRMKRNGAGLASICILGTMVLVSLSSSACLYIGAEDMLYRRYPNEVSVNAKLNSFEEMQDISALQKMVDRILNGEQIENEHSMRYASLSGWLEEGVLYPDVDETALKGVDLYSGICTTFMIPLEDYNRLMGTQERLMKDEALVYGYRITYQPDTFSIEDKLTLRVKKKLDDFPVNGRAAMMAVSSLFVIVSDAQTLETLKAYTYQTGDLTTTLDWEYRFDLMPGKEAEVAERLRDHISRSNVIIESREENRIDYFTTFGGLLFLGIMLSVVFLLAAVLIIYYKQISEGYEDQARFAIMQKVGMTRAEIRKSINSQMLTVFLLPLLTAGLHLVFAFPMVQKLLLLFNLTNTGLLIATTAASFGAFAVFYLLVYRITSNTYFKLVSQKA